MEKDTIITPLAGSIQEVLDQSDACTFLVGAGISMDAPSNLPSAREICKVLLGLCAPAEELDGLLSLATLRYEKIVEDIQTCIDPDLRFMEYFDAVLNPNKIHEFLASAITRRHHVITTNFDYLIERALMDEIPIEKHVSICPIITRRDFETHVDVTKLIDSGFVPVFKIHGSRKNIITGDDTRESLVTTISALGKDRAEGETFAIEPYKKPLVENIMNDRVLVVMGYSGSDDFDIGPLLKELPKLRRLIWVEHASGDGIEAFQIRKEEKFRDVKALSKVEALLAEIRHDVDFKVILVRSKTSRFVEEILHPTLIGEDVHARVRSGVAIRPQQPEFKDWAARLYGTTKEYAKYLLAAGIYLSLRELSSCMRVSEKGLVIAANDRSAWERGRFLNLLAICLANLGHYDDSLRNHEESLQIAIDSVDREGEAVSTNGIGSIHYSRGNFKEAVRCFEKAVETRKAIDREKAGGNPVVFSTSTGHYINSLAMAFKEMGEFDKAFTLLEEALKIASLHGELDSKAKYLSNMGQILKIRREYAKAITLYEEALRIDEQLGNITGMGTRHSLIGQAYFAQNNHDKAKEYFERSLSFNERLGDAVNKGSNLSNLAAVYMARNDLDKALSLLREALKTAEATGAQKAIAMRHAKIGDVYRRNKDWASAIKEYQVAIDIERQIGALDSQSIDTNNLALVYEDMDDPVTALSLYKQALDIAYKTGNKETIETSLFNVRERTKDVGILHEKKKEFGKAIEIYTNAMKEEISRGDKKNEAVFLFWIGQAQYKADENAKAKETLMQAMQMLESVSHDRAVSDCAYYLGMIEAEGKQHAAAIAQFARSLSIEAKLGRQGDQGMLLKKIAANLAKLDTQQVNLVPKQILYDVNAIACKTNDTDAAIEYLSTTSEFFERIKDVDSALGTHSASIAIARKANDKKSLQQLLARSAMLRRDKQDYQIALEMLEESLKIVVELGDRKVIAHRHSNIGMVHYKAKHYDLAREYFTKAKDLFQALGDEKNARTATANAEIALKAAGRGA